MNGYTATREKKFWVDAHSLQNIPEVDAPYYVIRRLQDHWSRGAFERRVSRVTGRFEYGLTARQMVGLYFEDQSPKESLRDAVYGLVGELRGGSRLVSKSVVAKESAQDVPKAKGKQFWVDAYSLADIKGVDLRVYVSRRLAYHASTGRFERRWQEKTGRFEYLLSGAQMVGSFFRDLYPGKKLADAVYAKLEGVRGRSRIVAGDEREGKGERKKKEAATLVEKVNGLHQGTNGASEKFNGTYEQTGHTCVAAVQKDENRRKAEEKMVVTEYENLDDIPARPFPSLEDPNFVEADDGVGGYLRPSSFVKIIAWVGDTEKEAEQRWSNYVVDSVAEKRFGARAVRDDPLIKALYGFTPSKVYGQLKKGVAVSLPVVEAPTEVLQGKKISLVPPKDEQVKKPKKDVA